MRGIWWVLGGLFCGASYGGPLQVPEKRAFPVDPTVNPCEDLYGYACNKAVAAFELPEDRSYYIFSFKDSEERLLQKKISFLQNLAQEKKRSSRSEDLHKVYQACMDPKAGAKEERSFIEKSLKDLQSLKSRTAFLDYLGTKRRLGQESLVGLFKSADQDQPDRAGIAFYTGLLSLPEPGYYEKKDLVKDFAKLLSHFYQELGYENPKEAAKKALEFEQDFAKHYPLPHEQRDLYHQKTSISREDLVKNYPSFRFSEDLKNIPKKTVIRHIMPKTYAYAEKLLATTPLQVLKDVYLYHALASEMDDGYPTFFAKAFQFKHQYLGGPAKRPPRDERCAKYVMHAYEKELDAELWQKVFPQFPEKKIIALAEKVRGEILKGLKANQWLSPQGKKGAIAKITAAKLHLVAPTREKDWDFNPKVVLSESKKIQNELNLREALVQKMYRELKTPRNRNEWSMGPLTVNAYYSGSDNKYVMPVGILQYPFYDQSLPQHVNLGAVGMVVGHELGHAIDDKGSRYDAKGRLNPWLSKEDLAAFKMRGAQFVKQFDKIGHNGELTLGENIGDLVGLTFAYQAAFGSGQKTKAAQQEFFVQYARLWCGVYRDSYKELYLKTNPHALNIARVNEQVKHQKGFYEAFACKKGDALYLPEKERMVIW